MLWFVAPSSSYCIFPQNEDFLTKSIFAWLAQCISALLARCAYEINTRWGSEASIILCLFALLCQNSADGSRWSQCYSSIDIHYRLLTASWWKSNQFSTKQFHLGKHVSLAIILYIVWTKTCVPWWLGSQQTHKQNGLIIYKQNVLEFICTHWLGIAGSKLLVSGAWQHVARGNSMQQQ